MVPFFGPEGEGWRWAEEGEMAYTGETALWKQINVYNTAHNHLVGHMYPNYFEEGFFDRQVPVSDDPLGVWVNEPEQLSHRTLRAGQSASQVAFDGGSAQMPESQL